MEVIVMDQSLLDQVRGQGQFKELTKAVEDKWSPVQYLEGSLLGEPTQGIQSGPAITTYCCTKPNNLTSTNPKDLIGAKKLPMILLPSVAIAHGNAAMRDGARKYNAYNWREKSVGATTYVNAAMRHLLQWFDREEVAGDSGVHHLGHVIGCCAILLDAQEHGCLIDDRPTGGGGFLRVMERLDETGKVGGC